jgi:glycosyltransferase involved in cell wall biosynthesis
MYPSEQFPSYGVFVRNIEGRLSESSVGVEKCVLTKKTGRILKLIGYARFIGQAFFQYHFKKYDLVYVHFISHSFVPLLLSAFHRNNKILLHVHGGDVLRQKEVSRWYFWLKLIVVKQALARADGIVVPSRYYRHLLIQKFGIQKKRIFVVASGGVDLSVFRPGLRSESSSFTIGYVGRLDHGKGVKTLLQAIASVASELGDFRCIVVGDGELTNDLIQLARSLNLGERVNFVGTKAQTELQEIITNFDTFVFPTERKSESLGLVGLEAMACGIPVIGSKIGGLEDYLVNDSNGYFFEPGNPVDLAQRLVMFRDLPRAKKLSLSASARKTALCYDASLENEKLLRVMENIAKSP